MQMKDSIYDMLHEIISTTLFLLVEIPDCIIQGFCKEKIILCEMLQQMISITPMKM